MTWRVLVVDDEPDILELVRLNLMQSGYEVETATTGAEALACLERSSPNLVVLDLMLPDRPGTEICRQIRSRPEWSELPVLMLTAKGEEIDRVVGFELGADDYVTKPFSPRELLLRVQAILRRTQSAGEKQSSELRHGELVLDLDRHRCSIRGSEVVLTAKEFGLLAALMGRPGRVMTRDQLIDEVWGSEVNVTLRTIDTHMKRLREKLGADGTFIDTIRGVGYRFAERSAA
ncbi:response regulator transcription factor [Myxococcota bacterium]|nr:response regulator transcription factor [Myxococcota bacterium]